MALSDPLPATIAGCTKRFLFLWPSFIGVQTWRNECASLRLSSCLCVCTKQAQFYCIVTHCQNYVLLDQSKLIGPNFNKLFFCYPHSFLEFKRVKGVPGFMESSWHQAKENSIF